MENLNPILTGSEFIFILFIWKIQPQQQQKVREIKKYGLKSKNKI